MKIKIFILLLIFLASCGVSKRKKAEEIIQQFEEERIADKREVVFNVQPQFEQGKLVIEGETSEAGLKTDLMNALEDIKFKDEISVLPDSTVGDKTFGLINLSVANHRSAPSHSAELVTQSLMGTPVKMLKNKNGWFYVQTPDKYISWVDGGGVQPVTQNELQEWKNAERIVFTGLTTEVYKSDEMNQSVSDIAMGAILEQVDKTRRGFRVELPDDRQGFTPAENWIAFEEFANQAGVDSAAIVTQAKKLTGRPYLWGGTSCNAIDCSGFTKTVYFMNGLILARDASLQTRHGKIVETEKKFGELDPGDLLFFGQQSTEDKPEKVTHVGISLGGPEFIHASGRVKVNSLHPDSANYSEYRNKTFVRARRIKGAEGTEGIVKIGEHPWY